MKANQILSDFAYYKQFLPAEDFQNMGAAPAAAGKQADEEEASNPVTAVCATKAAPKTAPISAQPAVGAPRGTGLEDARFGRRFGATLEDLPSPQTLVLPPARTPAPKKRPAEPAPSPRECMSQAGKKPRLQPSKTPKLGVRIRGSPVPAGKVDARHIGPRQRPECHGAREELRCHPTVRDGRSHEAGSVCERAGGGVLPRPDRAAHRRARHFADELA